MNSHSKKREDRVVEKMSNTTSVVLIILVVVAILGTGYFVWKNKKSPTSMVKAMAAAMADVEVDDDE